MYGSSIDWLLGSGIAVKVSNVSEPLVRNVKERSFKIYMMDTGLLTFMTSPGIAGKIVSGDRTVNNGSMMENAVAVMLIQNGYGPFFFRKSNSTLEIDFVISGPEGPIAIEVKSGRYDYPKSLITVMSERYGVEMGILLAEENIRTDDHGVLRLPLFAPCFLEPAGCSDVPPVDGMDRLNEELVRSIP